MLAEVMQGVVSEFPSDFSWDGLSDWFWHGKLGNVEVWMACVGFLGQMAFFSRFAVQWLASERSKKSVFPMAFWYLSLIGGSVLLTYGWLRGDPVIILGQAFGTLVYVRNIMFRRRESGAQAVGGGDGAT